jgi:hypothetical protein
MLAGHGTDINREPLSRERETRCHASPETRAIDRKLRTIAQRRGGQNLRFQRFPCRSTLSTARLKIVVSPVRVRVSPSRRPANRRFPSSAARARKGRKGRWPFPCSATEGQMPGCTGLHEPRGTRCVSCADAAAPTRREHWRRRRAIGPLGPVDLAVRRLTPPLAASGGRARALPAPTAVSSP